MPLPALRLASVCLPCALCRTCLFPGGPRAPQVGGSPPLIRGVRFLCSCRPQGSRVSRQLPHPPRDPEPVPVWWCGRKPQLPLPRPALPRPPRPGLLGSGPWDDSLSPRGAGSWLTFVSVRGSPVVPRLRLRHPDAGAWIRSLVEELGPTCCGDGPT